MNPATILTVDDDADMRRLIRAILDNGKRTLREAATALEGLRSARESVPDLLLLDIGLPGHFDGFSLCEATAKEPQFRNVRIIMVSGYDDAEDIELARRRGAAAYLVKPFPPDELRKLVERFESAADEMAVIPGGPQAT